MESTKQRGERTEAIVLGELKKQRVDVAIPFGEDHRYDFVIDVDGEFYRLQCKTGRYQDGVVIFPTRSIQPGNHGYTKSSYSGEIDFFVIYVWKLDQTYLVPEKNAAKNSMRLRVAEPKNNQTDGINWATEFRLDAQLQAINER